MNNIEYIYIFIYAILAVLVFSRYRRALFHPIVFMTAYWLFTFPGKFVLYDGFENYIVGGYVANEIRVSALGWSLAYYIGMLSGYFIFYKKKSVSVYLIGESKYRPLFILWIFGLAVFITFNLNLILSGNIVEYLANRVETNYGDGFYKVFGSSLLFISTIAILFERFRDFKVHNDRKKKRNLKRWVIISIAVGVSFLILEMVRGKLFIIILSILYGRHIFIKPYNLRSLVVAAFVLIVLTGLASQLKYTIINKGATTTSSLSIIDRIVGGLLVTFDSSDHLNNVLMQSPITVKETILQPFVDPILANVPRVLWDSKPTELGGVALQKYIYPELITDNGFVSSYYSVSGVGEALLLGGATGVLFLSLYVGWIMSIVARLEKTCSIALTIQMIIMANLFNVPRAGVFSLNSVIISLLFFLVPLLIASIRLRTSKINEGCA